MTTGRRVRPGDVFGIPLAENLVGVGIVLHASRYFKGAMLVGYYDQTFSSLEAINVADVGGRFVDTPNYTGTVLLRNGPWRIVGHHADLLAATPIPELRMVGHLYYRDEVTRQIPPEEWGHYTELSAEGGGYVENKLHRHFAKR